MKKQNTLGNKFYCTFCSSKLIEDIEESKLKTREDFSSDREFENYEYSEEYYDAKFNENCNTNYYYHCSNDKCYYNFKFALNFFHPIHGINSAPGDSWAIGYIK